jgi:hypothetical protein
MENNGKGPARFSTTYAVKHTAPPAHTGATQQLFPTVTFAAHVSGASRNLRLPEPSPSRDPSPTRLNPR